MDRAPKLLAYRQAPGRASVFDVWCDCEVVGDERKRLLKFRERPEGRTGIQQELAARVRSHYDDAARIANDVQLLGYGRAAAILAERLPRTARARSGELGEILATELVEEQLGYRVPIRRLRYKDGREMALRGDDFIGISLDPQGNLAFLKGESKSRVNLSAATIAEARSALSRDDGRPTPASLLFVADRLMDSNGVGANLGRRIRNEVADQGVPPARIAHALFTMSQNATPAALTQDLQSADGLRNHVTVHLQIEDHQDFIAATYEEALALGND